MWYLGCYYVIGIFASVIMAGIHLIKAEYKGYAALDYWDAAFPIVEKQVTLSRFIIGWTIWPIRLWQGAVILKSMYDAYDYRKYRPTKTREL